VPYRDTKRTRDERLGEAFKLDERFENLMTMSVERRDAILAGSPTLRVSYGFYVSGRSAALTLEKERTS
jgi:hypothetical protein